MKPPKQSAGILLYRFKNKVLEFFLVHPGGPFWAKKNDGAWGIPKGEFTDEQPLEAAKREFLEETGTSLLAEEFIQLTPVKLKTGKVIYAWAAEGDIDEANIQSNTIEIEWPPKSGKNKTIPEVDKGGWFAIVEALQKINPGQAAFVYELTALLKK